MSNFVRLDSMDGQRRYVNSDCIQFLEAKNGDWESGSRVYLLPGPAGSQTIELSPEQTRYVLNELSKV